MIEFLKHIGKIPSYEQPIILPILTQNQFLESLKRKNIFQKIIDKLVLVNIDYRGFDNQTYHGQIVIHKDLEPSIKRIFLRIFIETDFPMTSVFLLPVFPLLINEHSHILINSVFKIDIVICVCVMHLSHSAQMHLFHFFDSILIIHFS